MSPGGDGGGEVDLYHVHSGGCLVTHVNSGEGEGEEDLCHVCGGGRSVTDVPSGGWGRRGGSLTCSQLRTLRDTMGDGGREEELDHVRDVQSLMRRRGSVPCTQWGRLTDTCSQVGMGEERKICTMYTVGDVWSHMFPVANGEEKICPMYAVGDAQ